MQIIQLWCAVFRVVPIAAASLFPVQVAGQLDPIRKALYVFSMAPLLLGCYSHHRLC